MLSSNLTKPTIKLPINPLSTPLVKPSIKLLITYNVLITQSFLDIIAKNSTHSSSNAAYQVNEELMAQARPGALFMHCLPAHRGEEVTAAVFESEASIVFDQAENRLHGQKALLLMLFIADCGLRVADL